MVTLMKRFAALLIGLLLAAAFVNAYAGAGYNRQYWYGGTSLGNGIDRFGYGSYEPLRRYGDGTYDWQTPYRRGSPRYDGALLQPRYGYGITNARYGRGIVSPRYGYGVISPRYGSNFQSPRYRNWR